MGLRGPAQAFSYLNFSTPEGLPSSETYRVFQDAEDFIWVLTDRGVCRFDGHDFEVFSSESGLSTVVTFHINADAQGHVWLVNAANELFRFDGRRFWRHSVSDSLALYFGSRGTGRMYFEEDGTLHFRNGLGWLLAVTPEGHVRRRPLDPGVSYYCKVIGGQLVPIKNRHADQAPGKAPVIQVETPLLRGRLELPYSARDCDGVYVGGDGEKWLAMGCGHDLRIYSRSGPPQNIRLAHPILDIYMDRQARLWVGTREGVEVIQLGDGTVPVSERLLPGKSVSDVLQDREGGFWLTTLQDGLYYLRAPSVRLLPGLPEGEVISSMTGNAHRIVAGTNKGTLLAYKGPRTVSTVSAGDASAPVQQICWDSLRRQFLVPRPGGVARWTPEIPGMPPVPEGVRYTALCMARDGDVWAGWRTLDRLYEAENVAKLPFDIGSMYETAGGKLLIGTLGGLYSWSAAEALQPVTDTLLRVRINKVGPLPDGSLLFATHGNGLLIRRGGKTWRLESAEAAVGEIVHSFFAESDTVIWAATNKGLARVALRGSTCAVRSFSTGNGLVSNEVVDVFVRRDTVWAATKAGINRFVYSDIVPGDEDLRAYLHRLTVNGRDTQQVRQLHLPYHQNNISLEYRGISYQQMGRLNYRIRLRGDEARWTETQQNAVQYLNLWPGDYTFEVQVQKENDDWSQTCKLLEISIAPPWWQTWYVRLAGLLTLTLILTLTLRWRLRTLRRRHQIHAEMAELEKRALQAQMNPHFLFNSLNAVQSYISANETFKAEIYLSDFARLIRLILENSAAPYIPLSKEIELLEKYLGFEAIRFEGRITFEIQVDPAIRANDLLLPPMLIQPYLENAIVHGLANANKAGKVKLEVRQRPDHLFVVIVDNGVGRAATKGAKGRASVGMLVTQQRLEILNRQSAADFTVRVIDLEDTDGQPAGTRVEVAIPFRDA